jgi:peptidoglycan/xylan/chitin deacetylase (PgdA/CDA1 family)
MPGYFTLSLDCEGKWGVADHLNGDHHATLRDARLRESYGAIASLLRNKGMAATFAFTELFVRSRDELLALPVEELVRTLPYARPAFEDLRSGSGEGWAAPWALEMVADRHEIASHGVTHTPWTDMTREQARFELSIVRRPRGQTFIYPRNEVAHLDVLEEEGFAGYRIAPPPVSRARSLARELNLFAAAEPLSPEARLQPIPGGHFINWMSGVRRLIPAAVTRLRARRILQRAADSGGVAHFWTHPENIASAPATLANLEAVLEEADALRRQGRIEVATQIELVELSRNRTAQAPAAAFAV